MKKLKVIWGNWLKKIKKWEIVKMLNYKDEINSLNYDIQVNEQKIKDLMNLYYSSKVDRGELEEAKIKIASLEDIVKASDKALKEHVKHIKELDKVNDTLLTKTFNLEHEIKEKQIEIEGYKAQIEDLKSDRYLIKKVKAGRTPNTNKTKISKPMSTRVTKYMRGEHE